ncbi:PLK3 [Cordylochernes scorpioides]|uniref:PLK3 n=1 Tax=Cordylochernes scorpioides TaxID=51811 RepID=A0ABY6LBR0_9ARAC|nr:PLK3 [Cordylochernes scorpioides]UYV78155.1 PLK3 [Cordylochernes scorpioides]
MENPMQKIYERFPPRLHFEEGNVTFRKGRWLGNGGYALCFEAISEENGKVFACKVIPKKMLKRTRLLRLRDEIKFLYSLKHNNIVKLHFHFDDKNYLFLFLELCDESLLDRLKSNDFEPTKIRSYFLQIASACSYMHKKGLVHRDLKLANILLKNGKIKIADFGLSIQLDSPDDKILTKVTGTKAYLAPEVLSHQPSGVKADCWSLGCALYALTFHQLPYNGESRREILTNVLTQDTPIPFTTEKSLKQLLIGLLQIDPEKRLSMDEVINSDFIRKGWPLRKTIREFYKKVTRKFNL